MIDYEKAWKELIEDIQINIKNVKKIKEEEKEMMHNIAFLDGIIYGLERTIENMERIENDN